MTTTLYKYFPPERVSVLSDWLLRFSPLTELNDPVEGSFALEPRPSEAEEATNDCYKSERTEVQHFVHTRMATLGVLCLSKDPCSFPMWAHYASNHTGFVIGIDPQKNPFRGSARIWDYYQTKTDLSDISGFGSLRDVHYRDEPYVVRHGDSIPWEAFFTKPRSWSYEQEVRIFRSVADADKTIRTPDKSVSLFRLPIDALKCIIVGAKVAPCVAAAVRSFRHSDAARGITINGVQIDARERRLRTEPMPDSTD